MANRQTVSSTQIPFWGRLTSSNFSTVFLRARKEILGRDPKSCSISIQCQSISKIHCAIEFINGGKFGTIFLTDLNSRNGTSVNGVRIKACTIRMGKGDRIQFGFDTNMFTLDLSGDLQNYVEPYRGSIRHQMKNQTVLPLSKPILADDANTELTTSEENVINHRRQSFSDDDRTWAGTPTATRQNSNWHHRFSPISSPQTQKLKSPMMRKRKKRKGMKRRPDSDGDDRSDDDNGGRGATIDHKKYENEWDKLVMSVKRLEKQMDDKDITQSGQKNKQSSSLMNNDEDGTVTTVSHSGQLTQTQSQQRTSENDTMSKMNYDQRRKMREIENKMKQQFKHCINTFAETLDHYQLTNQQRLTQCHKLLSEKQIEIIGMKNNESMSTKDVSNMKLQNQSLLKQIHQSTKEQQRIKQMIYELTSLVEKNTRHWGLTTTTTTTGSSLMKSSNTGSSSVDGFTTANQKELHKKIENFLLNYNKRIFTVNSKLVEEKKRQSEIQREWNDLLKKMEVINKRMKRKEEEFRRERTQLERQIESKNRSLREMSERLSRLLAMGQGNSNSNSEGGGQNANNGNHHSNSEEMSSWDMNEKRRDAAQYLFNALKEQMMRSEENERKIMDLERINEKIMQDKEELNLKYQQSLDELMVYKDSKEIHRQLIEERQHNGSQRISQLENLVKILQSKQSSLENKLVTLNVENKHLKVEKQVKTDLDSLKFMTSVLQEKDQVIYQLSEDIKEWKSQTQVLSEKLLSQQQKSLDYKQQMDQLKVSRRMERDALLASTTATVMNHHHRGYGDSNKKMLLNDMPHHSINDDDMSLLNDTNDDDQRMAKNNQLLMREIHKHDRRLRREDDSDSIFLEDHITDEQGNHDEDERSISIIELQMR